MTGSPKFGGNFQTIKFLCPYPLLHERRHVVSFDFSSASTKYKPTAYCPLPNPLPLGEGIDWQAVPNLAAASKRLNFCILTLFFKREGISSLLILQAGVSTKYKPAAYCPLPNPLPRGEGIDWQAVPNLGTTSKGLSFCVLDFPHPREKGTSRRVCFSETPRAFRNPTNVRRQSAR